MSWIRSRAVIRFGVMVVIAAAALLPATAFAASARLGARPLHQGMRGPDVRALQIDLTRVGLHTTITGYFNPGTRRSVVRFQRENQLAATGRVGSRFVHILNRVVIARSITAVADSGGI